eukprot:jgi/Botrbrau1/4909/Bobra.118_1s0022.1
MAMSGQAGLLAKEEQAELVDITGEDASSEADLADTDKSMDDTPVVTKPPSSTGVTSLNTLDLGGGTMGLLWPGLPSGASVGAPVRTPSPPPAGMSRVPSQLGSARSPRSHSRGPLTRPQAPSARWSKSGWPARVSLPARPMGTNPYLANLRRLTHTIRGWQRVRIEGRLV